MPPLRRQCGSQKPIACARHAGRIAVDPGVRRYDGPLVVA